MKETVLIFGSSGTLGSAIYDQLDKENYDIYTSGKISKSNQEKHISTDYNPFHKISNFSNLPKLDAVVWANGLNISDQILNFKSEDLMHILNSNVLFIAKSISDLIKSNKIKTGARMVILSSIWQVESKRNKLSYSISKAAIQGLIKSSAIDLGEKGILINGILPGVVDSPMARKHLSDKEILLIKKNSALLRLPKPLDIANTVSFLISNSNKSITGQSLIVDCGFTGLKNNLS